VAGVETTKTVPEQVKTYYGRRRTEARRRSVPRKIKSKDQWNALFAQVQRGELTMEKFREMAAGVKYDDLPERLSKRKKKRRKAGK
jgi:hypothetical protein